MVGKPFVWSAGVSAALAFSALWAGDAARPAVPSVPTAYVDPQLYVAHPGTAIDSSLRFALQWLRRHQHAHRLDVPLRGEPPVQEL